MLVHGAGSYGHIPVRRFKLEHGLKGPSQTKGLAETKLKLLELERILDGIFLEEGVPVTGFLASDFMVTRNGRIASANLDPFSRWMRTGCIPMTGGDIVTDTQKGFAILSGDQIAAFLAIKLRAASLVFGIDVDGVFDSNPKKNRRARLVEELTSALAADFVRKASFGTGPDVTGGMAGKVREAARAARDGVPVYFVNIKKGKRLQKVVSGQSVRCSKMMPF